ncbi:MAG: hypothetical protein G01um1014106_42 [Parcubacteria group bacterium Gr01-1014_106]|nr:MAG: hypothetical protein G01um1014106_42 [Parcubacteria group bacterium Gr01-1014_106]
MPTLLVDTTRGTVEVEVTNDGDVIVRNATRLSGIFPCREKDGELVFHPSSDPRSPAVVIDVVAGLYTDGVELRIHPLGRDWADALLWHPVNQSVSLRIQGAEENTVRISAIGVGKQLRPFNTDLLRARRTLNQPQPG